MNDSIVTGSGWVFDLTEKIIRYRGSPEIFTSIPNLHDLSVGLTDPDEICPTYMITPNLLGLQDYWVIDRDSVEHLRGGGLRVDSTGEEWCNIVSIGSSVEDLHPDILIFRNGAVFKHLEEIPTNLDILVPKEDHVAYDFLAEKSGFFSNVYTISSLCSGINYVPIDLQLDPDTLKPIPLIVNLPAVRKLRE